MGDAKHTQAGDGRLFRNNVKSTTDTSGRHVADRSPQNTTSASSYEGRHRAVEGRHSED